MTTDSGGEMRWSADPPPGQVPSDGNRLDERHVAGTLIRFMCDYGVEMPLWDEDGDLPNDHDWLSRELGLSRELVTDLAAWASDWESPGTRDPVSLRVWSDRRADHVEQGRCLFERLRSEVGDRFKVVNRESPTH